MAFSSYCWGEDERLLCADAAPPQARRDVPRVILRRGERITFHLGFRPLSVGLYRSDRARAITLPARRTVRWRVKGRPDHLLLFARRPGGGDASYVVKVRMRP
jgi:hypothetical protein